jgi:hypothetical protein
MSLHTMAHQFRMLSEQEQDIVKAAKIAQISDSLVLVEVVSVNSFLDTFGPKIRLPQPRQNAAD